MRRARPAAVALAVLALLGAGAATAQAASTPPFVPVHHASIALPKGYQAGTPIWTKDGRHLLFSAGGELHRIGADGKGLTCLSCGLPDHPKVEPAVQEAFKDVFPDGKRILWGNFTEAWVLECAPSVLDCRTKKILPIHVAASVAPEGAPFTLDSGVWHLAPDGKHLGWTASRLDTRPMLVGTLQREDDHYVTTDVKVINPAGPASMTDPDPRGWTNGGALYELKGFSPDGRAVNYVSSQFEGNPDVFSVNLASGKVTRQTAHPDWDEDNGIAPDGGSMVLYSDRGMHRVDAAGLLPRRSFVDYPISANAAIYYVGTTTGFQCDLQPWLLPGGGDDGGRLAGQPLDPYAGGDLHAQNNVPGRGAWSPDSTRVALTEMSYKTAMGTNRLRIADLDRPATKPLKVVSSTVGAWARTPVAYKGVIDSGVDVTVKGLRAGTATIHYGGLLIDGEYSVRYDGYSDDGRSFVTGTEMIDTPGFGQLLAHNTADLRITGEHTGSMKADFHMGRNAGTPGAYGHVAAELDGYKLEGDIPKLGPCPTKLPKRSPLTVAATARKAAGGRTAVRVTVTADAAPDVQTAAGRGDRRPVARATVRVAGRTARTDARGRATIVLPAVKRGAQRVRATAGDTFTPGTKRVRVG